MGCCLGSSDFRISGAQKLHCALRKPCEHRDRAPIARTAAGAQLLKSAQLVSCSTTGKRPVQIDAFTTTPCRGNSAAVCLVPHDMRDALSDESMQSMAAENNLAETAFVTPLQPGVPFAESSEFHLRWFTPTVEVPLCGHATLASAYALLHGALCLIVSRTGVRRAAAPRDIVYASVRATGQRRALCACMAATHVSKIC